MRKMTDRTERNLRFALNDEDARLVVTGDSGAAFYPRFIDLAFVNHELSAVTVRGPRRLTGGGEHATARERWTWREGAAAPPWPPAYVPPCATQAIGLALGDG